MASSTDDHSEIVLDGMHFLVDGKVIQESAIDRLAPKQTTGDYTLDSNDLLSAWVLGDLTGGHGITDLREGVEDNRYSFGTMYTRHPNQISKPYSIYQYDIGGVLVVVRPLGDYMNGGVIERMTAADDRLFSSTTNIGAMGGVSQAREKGVSFSGTASTSVFYVPTVTGYTVYKTSGPTIRNSAAIIFRSFCLWDNKLIGISTAGQLYYALTATTAGDTTFTSYGATGKLDPAYVALSLEVYYNRSGEPAIHVITDQNVWIFDPATPRLYPIPDFGSVHPQFGYASAVWRGELFVAAGMDILAYNGNVVRNLGLSRDQGIPYLYQGHVVDLVAGQNSLYALVYGQAGAGSTWYQSVHEWSGLGWHAIYASIKEKPTQMAISQDGPYRLLWGTALDGKFYGQDLPGSFTNPRMAIEDAGLTMGDFTNPNGGSTLYVTLYYLETGYFDGNMAGYTKIANAVEVDIRLMSATTETYTLKYRINSETAWTTLGTTTLKGQTVFQFGTLANGIYPGISFERIQFRHELQDALPLPYTQVTSFVLTSAVFSYLVRKNPSLAWTCTVNLSAPHNEQSPANMRAKLTTLRTSGTFFPVIIQGTTYRARLSGVAGARHTGLDTRSMVSLSIVEIPSKLGVPV